MIPIPSLNSVVVAVGLGAAILSATYFKAPQLSISLIAGLGATALVLKYNQKNGKVKFYRLHNTSNLVDPTADLLLLQWPNNYGDPHFDGNVKASLLKSSVNLPCHLIAVADGLIRKEVVAHCAIPVKPRGIPHSYKKFAKMIKVGVPIESAKKAAKLAGLDPDMLDDFPFLLKQEEEPKHSPKEGVISFLIVKPEYRGNGLGKGICAFAMETAKELGIEKLTIFSCPQDVVPFFEKMGFVKVEADKRPKGVPKVRLHNEMEVELTERVMLNAKEYIRKVMS
ncbi:predicted protein [Nematostella vectensis]|uniref:Glucosamine 6-phosphate N-acetyltransferase n=1 Tax=Nematostella vectensis TaxID=45351 RepID=A7S2M4_NEMVE|nr:predicted protein [Nematostella vectensis]|eukprot:XP_001634129.1 predicted protein [Nematostella vectensis]